MTDSREAFGRLVRQVWMEWAAEQPDAKTSWLTPWEHLDERDREVDRRIGETVAAAARAAEGEGLTFAGMTVVPTAEYEELTEIKAGAEGRFPRCVLIKASPDRDLYVGWSRIVEAPVWTGTRAAALAEGCPPSRLRRADESGTSAKRDPMSYMGPLDGAWDAEGFIAEQRGWLPRARLGDYAVAYAAGRMEDCWDLLEPFEDATEVRPG